MLENPYRFNHSVLSGRCGEHPGGSMIGLMLAAERRWAQHAMEALAPASDMGRAAASEQLAPAPGEVDYQRALGLLYARAAPLARLGLRVAIWVVAWSPLWLGRSFKTLGSLPLGERQRLLSRLLEHPAYGVREAAFALKLCASLALLAAPGVRARSGYDGAVSEPPAGATA